MGTGSSRDLPISGLVIAVIAMVIATVAMLAVGWLSRLVFQLQRQIKELRGETLESIENGRSLRRLFKRKQRRKDMTSGYESAAESVILEDHVIVASKEQRASLHGKSKFIYQVYRTAQSFFTDDTNLTTQDKEPSIEDITIETFPDDGGDTSRNTMMSHKSRTYSHKSRQIDDDCRKQMVVTKSIDEKGGKLDISGVSLVIPSGSLQKSTEITLGLSWNSLKRPNLTESQAMLSPVIIIQPREVTLLKPVTLSFPHCAINALSDWKIQLIRSDNEITNTPEWHNLTLEDYDERDIAESRVTLLTSQLYPMYCCMGESKPGSVASKSMTLIAYSSTEAEKEGVQVKVYCVNDYSKCSVSAETAGSTADNTTAQGCSEYLTVYGDGGSLSVSASSNKEGETLSNSTQETEVSVENIALCDIKKLKFTDAWHDSSPSCDITVATGSCDINLYQEQHDACVHTLPIRPLSHVVTQLNLQDSIEPMAIKIDELYSATKSAGVVCVITFGNTILAVDLRPLYKSRPKLRGFTSNEPND